MANFEISTLAPSCLIGQSSHLHSDLWGKGLMATSGILARCLSSIKYLLL